MTQKTDEPALEANKGIDEVLRATGHTLKYWGVFGHTAHRFALAAEIAAFGEPTRGQELLT